MTELQAVTGVNDSTNALLAGTEAIEGKGNPDENASYTTNAEVVDAITKNSENLTNNKMNVEVKRVDDVVTELGVGNDAIKKAFWNGEGKKLEIHKVVGTNGQELVKGCNTKAEISDVFDSGNF